jgi:hypothetical protein
MFLPAPLPATFVVCWQAETSQAVAARTAKDLYELRM